MSAVSYDITKLSLSFFMLSQYYTFFYCGLCAGSSKIEQRGANGCSNWQRANGNSFTVVALNASGALQDRALDKVPRQVKIVQLVSPPHRHKKNKLKKNGVEIHTEFPLKEKIVYIHIFIYSPILPKKQKKFEVFTTGKRRKLKLILDPVISIYLFVFKKLGNDTLFLCRIINKKKEHEMIKKEEEKKKIIIKKKIIEKTKKNL
ncbi:hypothetical protein RFI_03579 [Reticulomyxa filosa]|uniref:Uncharacterized protein n=1 Tax=Reticulomyxa filosa TaxID=46433 RepID=X6P4R0_RETFI|nr:hypothetical protein RFI_03579 [Reticulomyxa filosa]|eukprot:ETO33525.1 hypothetical protein RFI_03579 [Reticulomyxa filosa]